jgi:hypothetical protein
MTVQSAIERADEMRAGNSAPEEMKIRWLSELDGVIYNDVILTHEVEAEPYMGYKDDVTKKLIAEEPYDVLYVYWLMAQIDLKASELNKYNNSLALFKDALKDYKAWFNRTHMPKKKAQIKLCIDGGR